MSNKEKSLGRGLSALISGPEFDELLEQAPSDKIMYAKMDDIEANIDQPRKHFDQQALEELASSIKQKGIISPVLVRKKPDGKFEIVAGERRYRAAKLAGLDTIPILVKEATDAHAYELSIIENVQRQDLNVVEEAQAYQVLIDTYAYSQDVIANLVSKSRSHIANILRLLTLPVSVIELLKLGTISTGHAKLLVGRDDAEQLASEITKNNLNVRQTEALVNKGKASAHDAATVGTTTHRHVQFIASSHHKDEDITCLETLLKEKANLNVKIDNHKKTVTISYKDLAELDHVLQLLSSK